MRLRRFFREDRGAALVEFALIVPLFLLMFFAIFDFAFLLYNRHAITAAVREGGRHAAVLPALADDDIRAQQMVEKAFNTMKVQKNVLSAAAVDVTAPTKANGYIVTVSVPPGAFIYEPFTPLGNLIGLGATSLTASASFRWELTPDATP